MPDLRRAAFGFKKKMYITFEFTHFAMVSGLNDMFPGNGVQRGLRYVFSCLVGVKNMSVQSAATCI